MFSKTFKAEVSIPLFSSCPDFPYELALGMLTHLLEFENKLITL